MSDLNTTLAVLKGQQESLRAAKTIMDQGAAALAHLQVSAASQIQATVERLKGLDTVGLYSSIDQPLRQGRFAGKSASIDAIKANPQISEADAVAAWVAGELAWDAANLPEGQRKPTALVEGLANWEAQVYRANLLAAGLIPESTYEAQRAWIAATDKAVIMGA